MPSKYMQKTTSWELAQNLSPIQITYPREPACGYRVSHCRKVITQLMPLPWSCSHSQFMGCQSHSNVKSMRSREATESREPKDGAGSPSPHGSLGDGGESLGS